VERVDALHHELMLESYSGMLNDIVIDIEQQVSCVGATAVDEQ
jgi:hypothetical protein